ncbi:MAG TPA: GGDEF domain-containing protein [Ruminococcaceae bacterium]|jgi:diguanylate cyclase (GGDEF)-like protein|nr:GGDEF domain-containing protein [Oscillospiraceae bacterium]
MEFENFEQLKQSVHALNKYFPIVHVWDNDHRQILYEIQSANSLESNPASHVFHNATLSIWDKEAKIEISIPISVERRQYRLELIRYCSDIDNPDSLPYIKRLVITDSLTNLYNRRYIDEKLPMDLKRTFQNGAPVSFIYSDIDFFKKINDEHGHVAGDYVLREVADIFFNSIRRKDGWAARYGGDEFLICLPELNHGTAVKIANRIRQSIEKRNFSINGQILNLTCSFGVQTVYKTSGISTVNQIIGILDRKLYRAKRKGRNSVVG